MGFLTYPFDPTGTSIQNLIESEPHVLTEINERSRRTLIPDFSPFYHRNFKIKVRDELGTFFELTEGIDFDFCFKYIGATVSLAKDVFGGVVVHKELYDGMIFLDYQTLGGDWVADKNIVLENLTSMVYNPRIASWDQVTNVQSIFPPLPHTQSLESFKGLEDLISVANRAVDKIEILQTPSLLFQQQTLNVLSEIETVKKRLTTVENDISAIKKFLKI